MKMNGKKIGAAVAVGGIAVLGYFLFPLVTALSIGIFPPSANGVAPLVRMAILNDVLPGLAVGIILGSVAVVLSPVRSLLVLMLPAILVFLAYLLLQMTLYPIVWNTRFVLTFFLTGWAAFFIGAAGAAGIGRRRQVANHISEGIVANRAEPSR